MASIAIPVISTIPKGKLEKIKAVFFDIDDTFSGARTALTRTHRITDEAYKSLWDLKRAGLRLYPVTGRPAGWCDLIARMWPVDGVIGENGAFYACLDDKSSPAKLQKVYLEGAHTRTENKKKLQVLYNKILKKYPFAKASSDQFCREFDLSIDYCEDVKCWSSLRLDEVIGFCRKYGATAKLSSIHINVWYGKYDKLTCVKKVMKEKLGLNPFKDADQIVYLGDSPNDEPFFKAMPFTVGVANVSNFLSKMEAAPAYITTLESGLGFSEFTRLLLQIRTQLITGA